MSLSYFVVFSRCRGGCWRCSCCCRTFLLFVEGVADVGAFAVGVGVVAAFGVDVVICICWVFCLCCCWLMFFVLFAGGFVVGVLGVC